MYMEKLVWQCEYIHVYTQLQLTTCTCTMNMYKHSSRLTHAYMLIKQGQYSPVEAEEVLVSCATVCRVAGQCSNKALNTSAPRFTAVQHNTQQHSGTRLLQPPTCMGHNNKVAFTTVWRQFL